MSEAKEPLFKRWQVQDHERANAIAGQIELMLCSAMGATRDCAWDEILAALTAKADLEQRVADIETRTSVKLGEFARLTDIIDAECKRLGIEWHGSASTTLKAVIEAATRRGAVLDAVGMFEKGLRDSEPSPSLPAGDGEAEPESGKRYEARDIGVGHICIMLDGKCLTREQGFDAACLLNVHDDLVLQLDDALAQLAKYKRDAEAWEKFNAKGMEFYVGPDTMHGCGVKAWCHRRSKYVKCIAATRTDAVLALASKLEAQQ
jgi:hypothetical protein